MIAEAIRLFLTNLPILLFIAAIVAAARDKSDPNPPRRYLSWLLLLSVGVQGIWAGLFHVFAPQTAASFIHWEPSPFQYEIGIADISIGIVAVLAFWRSLPFKAAVVATVSLFYVGLAIGHIREIINAGNYAPGNAGILLGLTIITPPLLIWLQLWAERKERSAHGS
ncbi:DUF6790 family protein [Pseudochelatococcus sp. B33]